ncbi:MAG: peptidoglycan editing factor PgeF [Verrucomicrobia bacterium]|nr:peptidoglycan editing factor PgeF [Verrucomicrobiota bacterium]
MIRKEKNGIEWLEYQQLQEFPEVIHGVFFRNLNCRDAESLKTIQEVFGLEKLIRGNHTHGNVVTEAAADLECDGLVTTEKNIGLVSGHADCQIAIFFDPVRKVIANVHSGWRGSVKNIYANAVDYLKQKHRCNPADLLVGIGPSLGPEKAEFINHQIELPPEFLPFQVRENYFDFWEISQKQLREVGVLEHHIEVSGICTYCEENEFFSHRREKKTGRNATVVALKPLKLY